jgi:SRSO17 transposase
MHHFVANSPWSEWDVLRVARDYALAQLERHAPIGAWIVDDTGIPKKGRHSVGVHRQYCGALGKRANCQVAVSISLANATLSVPSAYRLYLPKVWAQDQGRRRGAGVPAEVAFRKKWEIALEQIDQLLAEEIPDDAFQEVFWREGTKGTMRSRFAALRVRPANRDDRRKEPRPIEWLLIEWPEKEAEPTRYWLSTVPEQVEIEDLVSLAKIRWHIERDYQEMKDELGLDHYEGRNWRGFHHHGILCIAAYCFLAAERGRLSPPQPLAFLRTAPVPEGFTPRGSPAAMRET